MRRTKRPLLLRLAIWALVAFVVSIPVGLVFLEYTTRPDFCASCHIMEPYVESWRQSAHGKVSCVDCHYEPGILETAEGKFKAVNQVVKYVTGTEGTKPWAEVSDASCMRSGCHTTRLLAGRVDYEIGRTSIPFDHAPHLLEMRRSKKLRCTSCHSQIVQGEHLTVTATTCLLCHFKGAEEDPKLSVCTTCHRPPEGPIDVGGFRFVHDEYLARGVECETCHADITQGTGEVPRRRCGSCHAVQAHIERWKETEFLHRTHVTEHKVDCLECHTEMTHSLRELERTEKGECAQCHRDGHGAAEAMYRGEGGRGVPATPNPMHLARVGCDGCHAGHGPARDGGGAVRAGEVECLACHGPSYEGVLGRWQAAFPPAAEAVAARVRAAQEAAAKSPSAEAMKKPLEDAAHDAALVVSDRSRGVHNPWFARKLLEGAWRRAGEALAQSDPAAASAPFPLGPSFATKLKCAEVCHVGIETRDIRVPGTRFVHAEHVGRGGRDCDACHTVEPHGTTKVGLADCTRCHHGEPAPEGRDCTSCHVAADRFLRGLPPVPGDGSGDDEAGVQMMAKVACRECHGDPPGPAPRTSVQAQCDRCHGEKYAGAVAEWTADSDAWFAEAEGRLAAIRKRSLTRGEQTAALARAAAIVASLRRAVPSHNVLLFEEWKEAFEEAASAAER